MFALLLRSNAVAFTALKSFSIRNVSYNVPNVSKLFSSKPRSTFPLLGKRFCKCEPPKVEACPKSKPSPKVEPKPVNPKPVGYWLLTCSGMVFVAVIIGGLTRLTESGLSMVHWKLLGEMPPFCECDWQEEFDKYKEYPEFKMKNREMTLEDFKFIWRMEYFHRMWGRLIGAAFIFPATYFWLKGHFTPAMRPRVIAMGALLFAQGLMGWYMVRSGLEEENFQDENAVPRVSQYRLAAHLGLAFLLYSLFFSSTLDHLKPPSTIDIKSAQAKTFSQRFRMFAHGCKGLVFLTAVSGAFVAGLDAGLVYNSFPKMGDNWVPEDWMSMEPAIKNFTENPTTVQLQHRVLGTTTLAAISALWLMSRRSQLPCQAYEAVTAMALMAWGQVGLGITTLLNYVKTEIAAFHQGGSLVLLSTAFWLTHELKRLPK